MFKIDSKVDKPDRDYLERRVREMMTRGIKIGKVEKLYDELVRNRDLLGGQIRVNYAIYNPNSSKQVVEYMQSLDDATVTQVSFDNCGKWSSNKEILTVLADMGYEFADTILRYRKVKKYADSINAIMTARDVHGRIHPTVTMTKTNRVSYSNPALMSIPKELIWDCIVASEDGDILISADIKNQEPCIMINMQNVESLKPALTSDNGLYETMFEKMPIYGKLTIFSLPVDHQYIIDKAELRQHDNIPVSSYQATLTPHNGVYYSGDQIKLIGTIPLATPVGQIPELPNTIKLEAFSGEVYEAEIDFGNALNDKSVLNTIKRVGMTTIKGKIKGLEIRINPTLRKEFKRAWNAMTYGASKLGIINMCHELNGEELFNYFDSIPEIKAYKNNCDKMARAGIQNTKTYFGTTVSAGVAKSSALKRVLMDLPIQGTAADILSLLVKHFDDETKARGISDKLSVYFTRHDELIIEAKKDFVSKYIGGLPELLNFVKSMTEHQVDDWVPFKVDVKVISNNMNIDLADMEDTEDV